MDWLSSNGIWVLAAIAGVWFLVRRGGLHGLGMGGHHGRYGTAESAGDAPAATGAALDPVSGNPVRIDRALSAVFGGRAYYFESEDTRRQFEATPEKYAAAAAPAMQSERPRRRRGC